ncbi:integrase core domain-containing protein [Streptomyces sp. NBC_00154]|uniref:integrase core domain-containing protein n=1 Tax=Streptomyces sp. NBC_00154 TaxID=2975670 RepID=UPI002257358E|nr:integrase core domain-containing protein [Streptomyces sp. NBC_00154]MCX5317750.1 integrase core domain-containing protein [Streptomyces sp. NBC_00154]
MNANALAESFFATIKRELLSTAARPSRAAARTAIFDFIEGWYNLHRLHSSLGYRSPADYETALAAASVSVKAEQAHTPTSTHLQSSTRSRCGPPRRCRRVSPPASGRLRSVMGQA